MKIVLTVSYRNNRNEDATIELPVPEHADSGGNCGNNEQQLYFTWDWMVRSSRVRRAVERAAERENKVTFTWTPTTNEQFALSRMSMNVLKTSAVIEDLHEDEEGSNATASVDDLTMYAAPKGHSHSCDIPATVNLGDGAGITLSDVHLQAFNEEDEVQDLTKAETCPRPRHVSNGIYIAVGAILGGFALVAVIGYVVYRMRTRGSDTQSLYLGFDLFDSEVA